MIKEKFFWLIFGMSGYGKSTFLKWILRMRSMRRFILIDSRDEHHDLPAVDVIENYDELIKYVRSFRGRYDTAQMRIVYKGVTAETMREFEDQVNSILKLAMKLGHGMTVVAEECNFLMRPGDERMLSEELNLLISTGRHDATNFIGITQRPVSVNTKVRSQADAIFCFAVDEPADVKYVDSRMSVRYPGTPSSGLLPKYKCVVFGPGRDEELERLPAELIKKYVANAPSSISQT